MLKYPCVPSFLQVEDRKTVVQEVVSATEFLEFSKNGIQVKFATTCPI